MGRPVTPSLTRRSGRLPAIILSNVFVALCAASLVWASWGELGLSLRVLDPMVGLLFFATLLVYNLDRVLGTSPEDTSSARHTWLQAHRHKVFALTGLAGLGTLVCGLLLPAHIFWALVPLGALSLTYSIPFIRWRGRWLRLKDLPGLKIFLIALVWGVATVTLPAWHRGLEPEQPRVMWLMLERALFIFIITLPFDVRDLARDRGAGLRTLPGLLGVARTRALAIMALCVFMASAAVRHQAMGLVWPLAMSTLATGALLARLDERSSERYYSFYMEGTMLLQAALVVGWVWAQ